ncbi:MAG: ArsR family transcriptional regulator [Cetobacterium sp.]|uniref:ArsR family transcriptional regulator n=1 Tax=Cetobacterium sp. TaxID=2071632 RepID=UPI003EE7DE26
MKVKEKILKKINETPGITSSQLCEYFLLTKSNISIHLKNLEKEELIKKYLVQDKKVRFRLHPAKKGKEIYLKKKKLYTFILKTN